MITISPLDRAVLRQVAVPLAAFAGWVFLLFATPADRIFDDGRLFLWGLPPGAAVSFIYLRRIVRLVRRDPGPGILGAVLLAAGTLFAFLPVGFVALIALNCFGDPGPPLPREVRILAKKSEESGRGKRRRISRELEVENWRRPGGTVLLSVNRTLFAQASPGASALRLETSPGLLGHEWIVRGSLEVRPLAGGGADPPEDGSSPPP